MPYFHFFACLTFLASSQNHSSTLLSASVLCKKPQRTSIVMPFSNLPTELRQMVIAQVITTPFLPPSAPSEVRPENWLYPYEEKIRRHSHAHVGEIECNPAIAFNTQGPWGNQHLPLLLVNKAFRADTEDVLARTGRRVQPTLDVMLERGGDFKATWLLVPPSTAPQTEHLNIVIRTLGCMRIFGAEGSRSGKRGCLTLTTAN